MQSTSESLAILWDTAQLALLLIFVSTIVWPAQALAVANDIKLAGQPEEVKGIVLSVMAVAYSSTPDQTDASPLITASGLKVGPGVVAANWLPFGTKIRIGQQIYTVQDRLNARYNGQLVIDIWQPTRAQAVEFGVKHIEIEVLSVPPQ